MESVKREEVTIDGDLTVDDLPAAFARARAEASAGARHAADAAPPDTCRYCGGHLRLFPNVRSVLDGHARCCVTVSFQRAVYRLWWTSPSPSLSKVRIARACGVSMVSVGKWIAHVERLERAIPDGAWRGSGIP